MWIDATIPGEPCSNRLDSDSDGLNDYFENTTGCDLTYASIDLTNGSSDGWITLTQSELEDNFQEGIELVYVEKKACRH